MENKLFMGIDIGSTSTNAVVIDGNRKMIVAEVIDTHPNHKISTNNIFALVKKKLSEIYHRKITENDINYCVGTGYGRKNINCADSVITEITCHAKGANYFFPHARTVIDIGGQDSKAISIGENGDVIEFIMNEKCAAGSGRFLEIICEIMEMNLEDVGPMAMASSEETKISSMCTVFAQSEVISKLAENASMGSVLKGILSSICFRVISMGKRVGIKPPITFTGGVAKNAGMIDMLASQMGLSKEDILVAPNPQIIGALGSAVLAFEEYNACESETEKVDATAAKNEFNKFNEKISICRDTFNKHVIGWTDLATPIELLAAGGFYNTRIRGDIDLGATASDQFLRTYSCDYIKNSASCLLGGSDKYHYLDGIITTNCCTATEKMYDILEYHNRNNDNKQFIYSLTVPRKNDELAKKYARENIIKLKKSLENKFSIEIRDDDVRSSCHKYNQAKQLIEEYSLLLAKKNFPNSAALVAQQIEKLWALMDVTDDFLKNIDEKIIELKKINTFKKKGPNILLSGSIIPDLNFYEIFNDIRCQLVYNNTSSGNKFSRSLVDTNNDDIYYAIAERCLDPGYNPRMISIENRMETMKEIINTYDVEGIVFIITKFCVFYTFEAILLQEHCSKMNIPLLILESDFTNKGFGQLKTRIEAFIEILNTPN